MEVSLGRVLAIKGYMYHNPFLTTLFFRGVQCDLYACTNRRYTQ